MAYEKLIEYQGETHNITEWARLKGVNRHTLSNRLDRGWSFEKAIETPVNAVYSNPNTKFFEYDGETHHLREWAKIKGIPYGTLKDRLYRGWSFEEAIETPLSYNKCNIGEYIEYNGETHHLREWAKIKGIHCDTLKTRLKRGWSFEKAIETPARCYHGIDSIECNGETHSLYQWSCIRDIPYLTLYYRVHNLKWPIEEALEFKEHKDKRAIERVTKGDNKMLSTDVKVGLNKDNTYNIPVVWDSKEDEIVKKGIRESIPSSTLYQMLDGKHSVDSIELRKSILLKTMGMEYSSLVNEKQEYTMRDIVIHIYPTIDCTLINGKEYVRARSRVMRVMKFLGLDKHTNKKGIPEIYYNLTRAELNKIRIEIDKKFPEGIKCVTIGKQESSDSKEVTPCIMESPVIDKVEPIPVASIEIDQPKQQLSSIQQYYRTQIKQFNEFISKLQQSDNTKFKLVNVHCSDNSVKLWVEWE